MEYLKDIVFIIVQILAIAVFIISVRSKVDSLQETMKEIKEMVLQLSKDVKEVDTLTVRHDEKIKNLNNTVFGKRKEA